MTTFTPIASRRTVTRVPLISDELAKRHNVYCSLDKRFRRCARLLQALWLKDQGIPAAHTAEPELLTYNDFASTLHPTAAEAGLNFLSRETHHQVLHELLLREEGAAFSEDRLFQNSLSSQPMMFNMFAPLSSDLSLASRLFHALFPDDVSRVEHIGFEHSPGRREARFLNDGTAFDVVIRCISPQGEEVSIFIETKYSEGVEGPIARWRPRYGEAIQESRLFKNPEAPILRSAALEQFMREHLLAQTIVDNRITSKAIFLTLAPRLNRRVQTALRLYANELIEPTGDRVPFVNLTLDDFVQAIETAGAPELASVLWDRYLDFGRIYQLALADVGALPPPAQSTEPPDATSPTNSPQTSTLPPVRPRRSHMPRTNRHEASPSPASSSDPHVIGADLPSSTRS